MRGLGDQERRERIQAAIDAGARPPSEARRPSGPTEAELADPLLQRCRELHLAFKASRPRDWQLLDQRNAAFSRAEQAGRSLRAIARITGMSHVGVRNVIGDYRAGGRYSR